MRLDDLAAAPGPEGNRIVLTWTRPDPPGVRVVRRQGAFPGTPEPKAAGDGVVIADTDPGTGAPAEVRELPGGRIEVVDEGLAAETVHYYRVYPYSGSPPVYDQDAANRVCAMATGPYGFADLLYGLLPAIYLRYDTVLPGEVLSKDRVEEMAAADRERGQLRRFLELPGGQLDQLYSGVRSLLDLHDLARVDARLLPLLAHWIGWPADESAGADRYRAEIRDAPALYQAVQTVAAVEATVRRAAGWTCRTKEFADNVFLTNRPERLTLWLARQSAPGGPWSPDARPLSLDDAYDGRPAAVTDGTGTLWLFYATRKGDRQEIRRKSHSRDRGWSGSEPVDSRPGIARDPAAAVQGDTVWVFWAVHDQTSGRWRIDFRTGTRTDSEGEPGGRSGVTWSRVSTFRDGPADRTERRAPAALVDGTGALWLFWLERTGARWRLRYRRFGETPWVPGPAGSAAFPDDDGADPRVESDVFVLFRPPRDGDPQDAFRRIWVLWTRRETVPGEPEQTRWRTVSRFKDGTDPADLDDWGPVSALAPGDELVHEREPVALLGAGGEPTAFWSSTRDGSWSVWHATVDAATGAFGTPEPVTGPPFTDRAALAFVLGGARVVAFRSNRGVTRSSSRYRAVQTTDGRYSGSVLARTADSAAIALRGSYEDFGAYLYDTGPVEGRSDDDLYAFDTIGIQLRPDTDEVAALEAGRARIRRLLPEFMPANIRAVLLGSAADEPP